MAARSPPFRRMNHSCLCQNAGEEKKNNKKRKERLKLDLTLLQQPCSPVRGGKTAYNLSGLPPKTKPAQSSKKGRRFSLLQAGLTAEPKHTPVPARVGVGARRYIPRARPTKETHPHPHLLPRAYLLYEYCCGISPRETRSLGRLLRSSKLPALLYHYGESGLVVRPRRHVLDFPDREHRGRVEHLQKSDSGNFTAVARTYRMTRCSRRMKAERVSRALPLCWM